MSNKPNEEIIELQLGDIIKIFNPVNERLNDQTFIIDYLDKTKIILINTETLDISKLNISDDGLIGDGTITKLVILSRSDTKGYATQNNLLPNTWINIHFEGDYPVIITGEITNLESDMIEIKTTDGDVLYINFDYKGIPEDLPIGLIEIRNKPKPISESPIEEMENQDFENLDLKNVPVADLEIGVPVKNIKNQLREFILKADQLKFGNEDLGPIVQYMDVAVNAQRYSLETQVTELLDDMLSVIPNAQRTRRVLNNIHIIIERFKQLRENFSFFDQYGNVEGSLVYESRHKPLSNYFDELNHNLYWILPVVKNVKKIYDLDYVKDDDDNNDIINIQLHSDLENVTQIIDNYRSNGNPNEENKYSFTYNELNPYFTPFDLINPETNSSIISEKRTNCDINVLIDNLEDMYSSVFANAQLKNKRFVISKYNLGLSKLDTVENTSSKMITVRVKMTEPDLLSITSFLTLPEPVIRFSKVNMPGSSILEKTNLNAVFLNYWQLLNSKTPINTVLVDNIDVDMNYDEAHYAKDFKNYVLSLTDEQQKGHTKEEIYLTFVKSIIPQTRIIFNLMKKYIIGKLSIVDVVSYLEPFLIYTDNLTYMQYTEIIKFIDSKISEFNKTYVERMQIFKGISYGRDLKNNVNFTNVYNIISMINDKEEVFGGYDINIEEEHLLKLTSTNSELLCQIVKTDASKLYTSAISLQNIPLSFPTQFTNLFDDEKREIKDKINNEKNADLCAEVIIAKKYASRGDLERDNGIEIYFDKAYDKTNYEVLNDYESEIVNMSPENFIIFLNSKLKKKYNLDDKSAEYLSNTLLNGIKRVIDGQYAVVKDLGDDKNALYFIRKNNKWEPSETPKTELFIDDSDILCDMQQKCMSNPLDKPESSACESMKLGELNLQEEFLTNIINEFDDKYKVSRETHASDMQARYKYCLNIIEKIRAIAEHEMVKYNDLMYKYGANEEDDVGEKISSPNAKLLNLILKQGDFVKKQYDIVRFVNAYTRSAVLYGLGPLNTTENENWLYCAQSNIPILPLFRFNMASVFIQNPSGYNDYIDILISQIGKLSDDGNLWVDKHSGWSIQKIEDDADEGYEDGFKATSRAIIEDDAGNNTMVNAIPTKYETLETKAISNIINAITNAMGINMVNQKEFIINGVLDSIKNTLESEEDYKEKVKEMAAKNKRIMSYNDFYNTALLFYSIGMILIAIQTSIPAVKTRKTYPGCIRSFSGYPFGGAGDNSSLEYISCVVYDIRSSGEPWNVLKNKKMDYISSKTKTIIDNLLLSLPSVQEKFREKTEYILLNEQEDVLEKYNVSKWVNFLPPLMPFKITKLANVSSEFKRSLMNELKSGLDSQETKILVLKSKLILFSLAIQEKIENIIEKQKLSLVKGNNEPFLENSCCETNDKIPTITYFTDKDGDIIEYNNTVNSLSNMLEDITNCTKSRMLYSNINTKNKYPAITSEFDERIIYLSFIKFCKFKSALPIPEHLLPLCKDKPNEDLIDFNKTPEEIIAKLKQDGVNYNYDTFLRLIQLVSKHNVINIENFNVNSSNITKLSAVIENINDENDPLVDKELIKLLLDSLDTFDIATSEISKESRALNNYLIKTNEELKEQLIDFLNKNKGDTSSKKMKSIEKCLNTLLDWEKMSDPALNQSVSQNEINFYKNYIHNFVKVFPNIILNNVDYQNTTIPKYLGLSLSHSNKIKSSISDYYKPLQSLYGVNELNNILGAVNNRCRNIYELSVVTPAHSTIKQPGAEIIPIFNERTCGFLYEFYILKILSCFIDLTSNPDMIVTEIKTVNTVDDFYTEEYLEEVSTKVSFIEPEKRIETSLLSGNKKLLMNKTAKMIVVFIDMFCKDKSVIDISYDNILDRAFKQKETEKDMITDRLKFLTDEMRDVDTMFKVNKLGVWSKGLQKGLTEYVKETYDDERELREKMQEVENRIKNKNRNITDDDLNGEVEDYIYEEAVNKEIEEEEYNMRDMGEDYDEGNFIDYEPDEDNGYY
uniref:Uncharacterized protein n=1 Tax=viral metagenome TaxID=1070528 RepID=A0A6C0LNI1_9ZZZZ